MIFPWKRELTAGGSTLLALHGDNLEKVRYHRESAARVTIVVGAMSRLTLNYHALESAPRIERECTVQKQKIKPRVNFS